MTATTTRATFGPPPPVAPVPARQVRGLTGRRVVIDSSEGHVRDYRAVCEPFEQLDGWWVRVTNEATWYAWKAAGELTEWPAPSWPYPADLVYAEL